MAGIDPNHEWLGHVQPVGLVAAPIVLARYGLTPEIQTRADTEAAKAFIAPKPDDGGPKRADSRALKDPWAFCAGLLGWRAAQVAGAPGGRAVRHKYESTPVNPRGCRFSAIRSPQETETATLDSCSEGFVGDASPPRQAASPP